MDEMVDRLLDILADKLTERLSAGHKELYTAKELAERYGVSCATIRSKMAAGEFGELVSVGERTRLVPWAGVQAYESTHTGISNGCTMSGFKSTTSLEGGFLHESHRLSGQRHICPEQELHPQGLQVPLRVYSPDGRFGAGRKTSGHPG